MRCVVFFYLACAFACAAQAQPQNTPDALKYWIFLEDKPAHFQPADLHPRTQDRRDQRGTPSATPYDAPLDSTYLLALEKGGIRPLIKSRWLNAVSAWLTPQQYNHLQALSFVDKLEPVGRALPASINVLPESPLLVHPAPLQEQKTQIDYGSSTTQLALMNAIAPLERGVNGAGVRMGFLDTEYDSLQHRAFQTMRDEGRFVNIRNFAQGPQSSRHGLSVLSTAVGFDEGFLVGPAYGAEVLVATTEFAPTETNQEEDNLVAGLEWLEANGVDVVNISLGYTTFDAGEHSYTTADLDGNTAVTTRAVDIAVGLGMVVVSSAGNSAGCGSPNNCWYFIGTPADADSVIAVGAVRSDSLRAGFSSFGPTADGRIKPDVSAMGQGVFLATSGNGYAFSSGTSFSSPLTAAVVAQMLQVNPQLNPIEVRTILRETASQAQSPDNALGWGIINADAAVQMAETGINPLISVHTERTLPKHISIEPPYPNPFSSSATLTISASTPLSSVRISVFNLRGERVAEPFTGALSPGSHDIAISAEALPAGLYLYRVETQGFQESGKLFVVK